MKDPRITHSHLCAALIYCTRYCLGRSSYAPSEWCEILTAHVRDLDETARAVIARDIDEQLREHPDTHHAAGWAEVARVMRGEG